MRRQARWLEGCLMFALLALPAYAEPVKPASPASEEPAAQEEKQPEYNAVSLQGLNKVTGHISTFDAMIGQAVRFGNIEIIAHRCWKASPEDQPENAALLQISELSPGSAPKRIFLGWIFSSSPGLSGLEHPVYDVTLLSCSLHDAAAEKPAPEEEISPHPNLLPHAGEGGMLKSKAP